jgi:glyoxylase-like metal-dependent hydrolase (beta-lactamase superfamily II)
MSQTNSRARGLTRREFFSFLTGAGLLRWERLPGFSRLEQDQRHFKVQRISQNLTVILGSTNGAVLTRDGARLAIGGDPRAKAFSVERLLLTHARRDVIWAGRRLAERGALVVVPEKEMQQFTEPKAFWETFSQRRFHDYVQVSTKVPVEPWPVTETVTEGSEMEWRGFHIRVLETPGYTRGAVSYLLEVDGLKIAFTGDLIYGDGRVLDLYSFQDAIPEVRALGYHGFMARAASLIQSLQRVLAERPDLLVPSRGPLIPRPAEAIARLVQRLRAVYRNYLSVCDLRWIVPERMQTLARRMLGEAAEINYMPAAEIIPDLPPWLIAVGNSRVLRSEKGAGFVIDCGGGGDPVGKLKELQASGRITSVDGIYLTHYHDDHVGSAQEGADAFGCPIYACAQWADILLNPRAYRMPAQHHEPIRNVVALREGSSIRWKEFTLTSIYFPGQTLYHGALVLTRDSGERIWFIGDSFSPTGLADHCPQNRQFLRENAGLLYCLNRLAAEPGALLVNQHIAPIFRFSPEQIAWMQRACRERIDLLRDLFPWDDPNFGLDEGWARCHPYETVWHPGQTARLAVRLWNHSPRSQLFEIRPYPPAGWKVVRYKRTLRLKAQEEGELEMILKSDGATETGVHILVADVRFGESIFPRWVEGLILVKPGK